MINIRKVASQASLVAALVGISAAFNVTTAFAADAPATGGACLSDGAKKDMTSCPNSGPSNFDVSKHGKAPQVNFHSAPQPKDLKTKDQQNKPQMPTITDVPRDERKSKLQNRARALLVTEISGLESLFGSTAKNSPDRVDLARRLAEDYVELETAAFKEKTQAEVDRDNAKKTNPQLASQKQAAATQANQFMTRARTQAEKYYGLIKSDYPNYSKLDEVLYYLAYEYEQSNDNAHARQVYLELIKTRPQSKYIPNAYLAFGELFFNEAQGDPSKFDLAAQAYQEVIKYPPQTNKVYGYAWYKLGYVKWNQGDFTAALNAFKKTIDWGTAYRDQPGAAKLADSARHDTIPVYALKGDPGAAYNYFHTISGDDGGSNDKTYKMMDDLGQNYLDTGHYPEAITLYRDLMGRDKNGDRHCNYQSHISEATLAMKSGNKDAVKQVLVDQGKIYQEFKAGNHSADSKQQCANKTAELVSETAMAWHLEAVGSNGQRGTGDAKTMALAAQLYKEVVDTWNQQEFSTFTFPRIVKDDWPTICKIRYAMADLLYFQKDWAKCGPAFDSVVAENCSSQQDQAEAAYAAVLCYQNIYEQTHAGGADRKGSGNMPGAKKTEADKKADDEARLQPKPLTDNQKGMIQSFKRYICYIHPAASDKAGQDQLVEVKYALARTYFEAQHWEEAAIGFREVAMTYPDNDAAVYAAQLYLESVNVMGAHGQPPRTACFDDMATDVPKFLDLYCGTPDKQKKNEEQCTNLAKTQVDILRLKAQKLVEIADKNPGPSSAPQYEQAGNAYLDLFRKYCETPIRAGQQAQAERCDEIIYNAARAYQAARLIAKSITARKLLLDPALKMDKSELAKKATYEIGGNYQAIAVYDMAADWFEKFAKENPKAEHADTALSDAVLLRLGLGDEEHGIDDAATFRKNYGQSHAVQAAAIAYAIGAHYADKEDWKNARTSLEGAKNLFDKAAPDIQVQAHATLAKSYVQTKADAGAKTEYAKVRALWSNPGEAVNKINGAYPDEDSGQKAKRVGKALNAVGEAYFYEAEQTKKATVDTIKFPEYKGPGTKDDVLKHINTKVVAWLDKKKPAIDKAEAEYKKIIDLQPDAPPKWVIAAGSRVGLMWGDFVDDFRRAPIPDAWKKDAELRGVYYDALDGKSQPIKDQKAKPALVTCLAYSVKFQYFDDYSRACEVWLAKNYKAEYHVVDELRPSPTLSNSGLDERPPPVTVSGGLYHPASATSDKPAGGTTTTTTSSSSDDSSDTDKKPAGKKKPGKKGH
ncbi:MAG TPA: hypothetical protein VF407_17415 [Polyangiaceae bacterium]